MPSDLEPMRNWNITFRVTGRNYMDAMNQAERYLNTGDRCVDFNIDEEHTAPCLAPRIEIDPGELRETKPHRVQDITP